MKGTRVYKTWAGMMSRCYNSNETAYCHYGARGIKVCDEWHDSVLFMNWALNHGYADSLTIERINNDGDYCPENCRWATIQEQARNKRTNHYITIGGITKLLCDWAKESGVDYTTIIQRIKLGWPTDALLKIPCTHRKKGSVAC
jgi:hypothetical protein